MMYPPIGNAVQSVLAEPQKFSTLATALTVAELIPTLEGEGPFTIFAPTNEAFAKIDNLDEILGDKELLTSILLYHVVGDAYYTSGMENNQRLMTVQGNAVRYTRDENNKSFINGAAVERNDWSATNAAIHVIDTVLLPPSK